MQRENGSCSFAEGLTIEEGEIHLHAPSEMKRKKTQMVMGLGLKRQVPFLCKGEWC